MRLVNRDEELTWVSLHAEVAPYDGPLEKVPGPEDLPWIATGYFEFRGSWLRGQARRVIVGVEGRALSKPGTYILRLILREWKPASLEGLRKELASSGLPAEALAQLDEQWPSLLEKAEVDLEALFEDQFRSEDIWTVTVVDYVRVEPFSYVLNFGLFLGTFVTALATIVLAVQG
jgi:hypothetical protein